MVSRFTVALLFVGCTLDAAAPVDLAGEAPELDAATATERDLATTLPTLDAAMMPTGDLATGCPTGMVAIADSTVGNFCIDRYEAPNEAGVEPLAFQTARDGEKWCGDRQKRLCKESEWLRACQGPSMRRYPYGNTWMI